MSSTTPKVEDATNEPATTTTTEPIHLDPSDPTKSSDGKPLPLPAPPANEEEAKKLDMSSGETTVKMDHLGPLVVNQDGTLSRIANWGEMSEIERRNTLRILGKRNQLRQEILKAKGGEGEGA